MSQENSTTKLLRYQYLLINAGFGCGFIRPPELARCNIGYSKGVFTRERLWAVRQPTSDQELFQVTAHIPVSVLNVSLKAKPALGKILVEKVHVPGARLVFVYLTSRCAYWK